MVVALGIYEGYRVNLLKKYDHPEVGQRDQRARQEEAPRHRPLHEAGAGIRRQARDSENTTTPLVCLANVCRTLLTDQRLQVSHQQVDVDKVEAPVLQDLAL